ncbi:hypothetical protein KI387_038646, partial [Taxus chinensis]
VELEQLEGKAVGIFMCDIDTPFECIKLQQIYQDLKLKDTNFEGIWIPLLWNKHYGLGTCTRSLQEMSWAALPHPNLVNLKNKKPQCVIFDKEGRISNSDALTMMMSWGIEAYPFTQSWINNFFSNMHVESSLEFLSSDLHIVKKEPTRSKLTFLYAEPPTQKLNMKSDLEKLAHLH